MHFYAILVSVIYVLSTALTHGALFEVPGGVQAGEFPLLPGKYLFIFPKGIKTVTWRANLPNAAFIDSIDTTDYVFEVPIPPEGHIFDTLPSAHEMEERFVDEIEQDIWVKLEQLPDKWYFNPVEVRQPTLIHIDPLSKSQMIALVEDINDQELRVIWPTPSNAA